MAEKNSGGSSNAEKSSEGKADSKSNKESAEKGNQSEDTKLVPENECSICKESLQPESTMVTSCNHKFHRKCILTWLNDKNTTCPNDRTNLAVPAIGEELDTNESTLAQRLNLTCSSIDLPDPKNGPYSREIVFSTPRLAIEAGPGMSSVHSPHSEPNSPASSSSGNQREQTGRGRQQSRRAEPDPVGQALMGIAPGRNRSRGASPSPSTSSNRTQGIDPTGLQMSSGRGSRLRGSSGGRDLPPLPMPPMDPEPHKMIVWFNNLRPQVELKNMSDQYNVAIIKGNKILGVVPKRSKVLLLIFLIVGPPGKSMIRGNLYPEIDTLTFYSNGIEKKLGDDDEYKRFISSKDSKRSVAFVTRRDALSQFITGSGKKSTAALSKSDAVKE